MDPKSDAIRDYILANRDRYTREAISEQLVAAGHSADDVDRTWDEVAATQPQPQPRRARLNGVAIVAIVLLVIGAAFGAFGALLVTSLNTNYADGAAGGRFFLVYAVLYLGIGSILVWVATRIRASDTVQFVLGVLLVPVYIGLMLGTCAAAVNLTS
jgi:hypothetical protein